MKATELMIGDWVGRVFDDKRIDYRQVDWIRTGEIGMRYQKVWAIGCIEPIPLTPEILEKNEFHLELSSNKENVYSHFDEGDCTPIIFLSAGQEKWTLHVKNYILKKCLDFIIFHDTLYVHELQHTLQLCGLDELADNFKV